MNTTEKCRVVQSYLSYIVDMKNGMVYVSSNPPGSVDLENTTSISLDVLYNSLYDQMWNYVFDDQ